jgi:hypothetical protein
MAAVSDAQVAALRATLMLDPAKAAEARSNLTAASDLDIFAELAAAAFMITVSRQFTPPWTRGDIVRFVNVIWAIGMLGDDDRYPLAAETAIRRALGDQTLPSKPVAGEAAARAVLLVCLAADQAAGDAAGLDHLLEQARKQADRWLAERA